MALQLRPAKALDGYLNLETTSVSYFRRLSSMVPHSGLKKWPVPIQPPDRMVVGTSDKISEKGEGGRTGSEKCHQGAI